MKFRLSVLLSAALLATGISVALVTKGPLTSLAEVEPAQDFSSNTESSSQGDFDWQNWDEANNETALLYLFDQATRTIDPELVQIFLSRTDTIISVDFDNSNGAFSLRPDDNDTLPIKTLATQALLGRVLIRAWAVSGEQKYRAASQALLATILDELTLSEDRIRMSNTIEPQEGNTIGQFDPQINVTGDALMIATLAEASFLLDDPAYILAAEEKLDYLLKAVMSGGQFRVTINPLPIEGSQLSEIASIGLAMIALRDYSADIAASTYWQVRAEEVAQIMLDRFKTQSGLMRSNIESTSSNDHISLDDHALPAGNALALNLLARTHSASQDQMLGFTAWNTAQLLSDLTYENQTERAALLQAISTAELGVINPIRFGASGVVRVEAQYDRMARTASFELNIAEDWHVQSNQPFQDYLIPTRLEVDGIASSDTVYPDHNVKNLNFTKNNLSLFEGNFTLETEFNPPTEVVLHFQACSADICMQPEQLRFVFW